MSSPTEWFQTALVPPSAVEVRIRLGFVPERDHAQVMVEAFDPATRAQIAAWSRHHFRIAAWPEMLEQAVQKANEIVQEAIEPF